MKKWRYITGLTLLICFLITLPVHAKPVNYASITTELDKERIKCFNSIVQKHMEAKSSQQDIQNELMENGFYLVSQPMVNNYVKDDEIIGILSNEDTDIDLPSVVLFQDYNNPSRYVACGQFFWNYENWDSDIPSPASYSGSVGGKDAFGITFSKPVNILSKTFDCWGNDGTPYHSYTVTQHQYSYGCCFEKQDYYFDYGDTYSWDSGCLVIYFTPQQTGQYAAWQTLGHTWSSADISSISIGSGGMSVTFTNVNYSWKAVAPTSGTYTFY